MFAIGGLSLSLSHSCCLSLLSRIPKWCGLRTQNFKLSQILGDDLNLLEPQQIAKDVRWAGGQKAEAGGREVWGICIRL